MGQMEGTNQEFESDSSLDSHGQLRPEDSPPLLHTYGGSPVFIRRTEQVTMTHSVKMTQSKLRATQAFE